MGHRVPLATLDDGAPDLCACRLVDEDMPLLCALLSLDGASDTMDLDISANRMTDVGLFALAGMLRSGGIPHLSRLSLENNALGDDGLRELAAAAADGALPELLELRLAANALSLAGVEALVRHAREGGLRQLQTLDLSACGVDDPGLDALGAAVDPHGRATTSAAALPRLQDLLLAANRIGDGATRAFVERLVGGALPELRHLNLRSNLISVEAAVDVKARLAISRPDVLLQLPDPPTRM